MRWRGVLGSVLLVATVVAAIASYRAAHRPIPLEAPAPPPQEDFVGRALPAFSTVDLKGRLITPQTLRGHVAVVNIWATWCKPCVEELPRIEREIWQQYQPTVVVLGVVRGQGGATVGPFAAQAHLTYSVVPDPERTVTRLFGADSGLPRTYVVGRTGTIVYQTLGYVPGDFERLVAAIKKEVERE